MADWKLDRQTAYVPDVIPDSDLAMYRKANFGHPIAPLFFGRPDNPAAHESAEIPPEIAPRPDEPVIVKGKPSAFFGTQLHSMLTFHGVDTLIVTGMVTSGCVRAAVDGAFSHDYRVIIPEGCVADRAEVPHRVDLFDMEMISEDVASAGRGVEACARARIMPSQVRA